jgi:hypothetical protein
LWPVSLFAHRDSVTLSVTERPAEIPSHCIHFVAINK